MKMKEWNKTKGEQGQSLVEFALVLPMVLILLVASADIWRIVSTKACLDEVTYGSTAVFQSSKFLCVSLADMNIREYLESCADSRGLEDFNYAIEGLDVGTVSAYTSTRDYPFRWSMDPQYDARQLKVVEPRFNTVVHGVKITTYCTVKPTFASFLFPKGRIDLSCSYVTEVEENKNADF